ncbi:MAG: tyrosine recombinase XerC [Firmicutes bacterium]|nr:tyrosine recombinase XerC [Bacillota bacterium]
MVSYLEKFKLFMKIQKNAAALTIKGYERDIAQFFRFLDSQGYSVQSLNYPILRHFLALLKEQHYSRSTIARKISAVRAFLRYLKKEGVLSGNSWEIVSTPKKDKRLPVFLYPDEVLELLEAPEKGSVLGLRDRAILEILYGSGVRVSELTGLNLADVDMEDGFLRILGKGTKERIVPIGKYARQAVAVYLRNGRPELEKKCEPERQEDALFLNKLGQRLSDRSVRRILSKYSARIGLGSQVSPHALRHSFASHMLNAGADLRIVQDLLGHASISTTQIYTHITKDELKRTYLKTHPRA